jgi:hypothetical protein
MADKTVSKKKIKIHSKEDKNNKINKEKSKKQ